MFTFQSLLLKKKSFLPELTVAIQQFLREIPIYQKTHQKMDVQFLAGKKSGSIQFYPFWDRWDLEYISVLIYHESIVNVGKDTPVHWILLEACRWFPRLGSHSKLRKGEASLEKTFRCFPEATLNQPPHLRW